MWTKYINESQNLFNRNVKGFIIAAFLFFYIIVFSPLWYTGFMIEQWLFPKATRSEQVLIIGCFSVALYCILFLLKGILLYSKVSGNLMWIPLYLICTGYACITPAIVAFAMVHGWNHPITGVSISLILFSVTYAHYQFHADGAPGLGRPAYHLGVNIASKII